MKRDTQSAAPNGRIRICFLSYRHLSRLARTLIEDYSDRAEIEVIDEIYESALGIARAKERHGLVDAFVSAGANAAFLRGALKTPVATVKVGGYDLLLALLRARQVSNRVGVITFGDIIHELDAVKTLLSLDVAQRSYRTPEEARDSVSALAASGHSVMVGSSIVCEASEAHGIPAFLAYSPASVRQAIEDGIELARIARLEAVRTEQLTGILNNLQDAVLAVDASNRLTALNGAMEELLGAARHDLVGRALHEIEPSLSLSQTLNAGLADRGAVLRFARRDWIANRIPVLVGGQTVGATLSLSDSRAINEAERTLRSRRRNPHGSGARYDFSSLKGSSPAFERAVASARRFARTDLTVLISGESGTGKELFAQSLHRASQRADRPFVAVNCSAFPESLLESELFGYEEGAFTGARKGGKPGLFEAAHTGTLFLDEIGDMPLTLQTRLLRVLQEREVVRLGGVGPIPVDVRIVAASHQQLDQLIRERRFRGDLFYRLNILHLRVPPLRDRGEDIELLAASMLGRCLARLESGLPAESLIRPIGTRLRDYPWPGNVRELENVCERLAVFFSPYAETWQVDYDALALEAPELFAHGGAELEAEDQRGRILGALAASGGSRERAARRLGISRATLWRRMQALGLLDGRHPPASHETAANGS